MLRERQASRRSLRPFPCGCAHFSSLTVLEACALFTLMHQRATGEDILLKCAAASWRVRSPHR